MDYQGNSKKDKEKQEKPEKVVEKVIVGEVIKRKPPMGTRFKTIFFGGEFREVVWYVADAVLFPALRDLIVDIASQGARRMVYGNDRPRSRIFSAESREVRPPRVTYNNPINRQPLPMPQERQYANIPDQRRNNPQRKDNNQIVLTSRADAEQVLETLTDIINQWDVATVADLYELVGLSSTHVDHKWGWTFLSGIEIIQVRDGYLIELPPAEAI